MKKQYTVIWEDRWQSGSHHHCLTKRTFIECDDIKDFLINSELGHRARFIFEGFQLTIGEEFDKNLVEQW